MTNYILPSATPSNKTIDRTTLTYPCRVTDLRTGEEYVYETSESNTIDICPIPVPSFGATGDRPTYDTASSIPYFDTTLGKPVWFNGKKWVDATGADA